MTTGVIARAFGYWFPPPLMAGHAVQHNTNLRACCLVDDCAPDVRGSWLSRDNGATVRATVLPPAGIRRLPPPSGWTAEIRVGASRNARGRGRFPKLVTDSHRIPRVLRAK